MWLQNFLVASLQWPNCCTSVYSNSFLIIKKLRSSWMMKTWNPRPGPRKAHQINSKWPEDHSIYYSIHIDLVTFTIGHNRASYIHFHTYRKRKIAFFSGQFQILSLHDKFALWYRWLQSLTRNKILRNLNGVYLIQHAPLTINFIQDIKELKHGIIMHSWLRVSAKVTKGYQADIIWQKRATASSIFFICRNQKA